MADPLAKVVAGDSPGRLLQADSFNLFIDAAKYVQRVTGRGTSGRPVVGDPFNSRIEVWVKNTTSVTLPIHSVVKASTAIISPKDVPLKALHHPVVGITAPVAADDQVLITIEPIESGKLGRAVVMGVAVVSVFINDLSHTYAQPVPGQTTYLESVELGPIPMLVPPEESGTDATNPTDIVGDYQTMLVLLGSLPQTVSLGHECEYHEFFKKLAGASDVTSFRLTRISQAGKCVLGPTDATDGGPDPEFDLTMTYLGSNIWGVEETITICGLEWSPAFYVNFSGGVFSPQLLLQKDFGSGVGTVSYWGLLVHGCPSDDYLTFSFGYRTVGTPDRLCLGTEDTGNCADNTIVFKVECECAYLTDYAGPGWYCVRDAADDGDVAVPESIRRQDVGGGGVGAECVAVYLDSDDRCRTDIVICSGPFDSEELAQDSCDPIYASCFESGDVPIARRLYIKVVPQTGCLLCGSGVTEILYNGSGGWDPVTDQVMFCDGQDDLSANLKMYCDGGSLVVGYGNTTACLSASDLPKALTTTSPSDPLLLQATVDSDNSACCDGSFIVYISNDYATIAGL